MKNKYWFILILCFAVLKLHGQDIRVGNNFIILFNDKLTSNVAALQLILTDTTGKAASIKGGYIPGELFVTTVEAKKVLFADSVRVLTLAFDNYEYKRDNMFINNFKIFIDRRWFKSSMIILRIFDINKRRGTYKYSYEVPGYSFALPGYAVGKL